MSPPLGCVLGGWRAFPCHKMLLSLRASTMLLEGGAASCRHPKLVLACFLKQMMLFHLRMRFCKIKLSPFHWEYPWTPGNSTPFQKSGFLGVYSKSREGGDTLGSLCLLPLSPCVSYPSVSHFATGLRARFLPLPGVQGLCVCVWVHQEGGKQGYKGCQRKKKCGGVCIPSGDCGAPVDSPSLQFVPEPPGTGTSCRRKT